MSIEPLLYSYHRLIGERFSSSEMTKSFGAVAGDPVGTIISG